MDHSNTMKIEQGYRSRADKDGARVMKTCEDQEGHQGKARNSAIELKDATEEGCFHVADGRKDKSLRLMPGKGSGDEANVARSRALQEAVCQGVMQVQRRFQQPIHTQQTSLVHWERFLPQRQLQVLLVENDDATRHVVSALLRNCSYEVTSAANGQVAWELLMDQSNHVDLVLTEVVLPCLSGTGLLARIMSHEALEHIPVIMMSSHDAMNVVFKCLSKGAVDFLVKPVRKNELKNLWQHVWRRCNSSSGNRSANGSQTQKAIGPNIARDLNDSGSSSESDKTSSEIGIRGGSDNGSGTQSRWTKGAVEVESGHQCVKKPKLIEMQLDSGPGSANAVENMFLFEYKQHEGRNAETAVIPSFSTTSVPVAVANPVDNVTSAHDSPRIVHAGAEDAQKINKDAGIGLPQENTQIALDLIGKPHIKEQDSNEEQHGDNEDEVDLLEKHASNSFGSKDKNLSDSSSPSLLESAKHVGMKRMREVEDQEQAKGTRGGLIHSYTSAFSRYNTSINSLPLSSRTNVFNMQAGHFGCDNGVPAAQESHTVSAIFTSQKEKAVSVNGGSDEKFIRSKSGSSIKPENLLESCPPSRHDVMSKEGISSLPPLSGLCHPGEEPNCTDNLHAANWEASAQAGESGEAKDLVSYKQDAYDYSNTNSYSKYHHHSHHHHHHHIQHHFHHLSEEQLYLRAKAAPLPNDQTVTDVGAGAPGCGSSNMANGSEGIMGPSGSSNGYGSNGYGAVSVNGNASGSNYGSNGQSAAMILPGRGNTDRNTHGEPEHGLPDTNGILAGHDENRCARREAALTKFRQKRKERCFEKKVRYQSRKRLAEQRPRVRGQFVKQTVYGSIIGESEQS